MDRKEEIKIEEEKRMRFLKGFEEKQSGGILYYKLAIIFN